VRLVKITIQNFRSIAGKVTVEVPSRHIALVGANNAGKSNIISAIDWVLGNRTPFQLRASEDDFFDRSKQIVIEATLGGVNAKDKVQLMQLATNQQQRGALSKTDDPQVVLTVVIPPAAAEHDDSAGDGDADDEESVTKPSLQVKLWGFKTYRKQKEIRRELVSLVRVGADRSVGDDLQASRWTHYGQLMKDVMESSIEFDSLVGLLAQVNEKIQEIFAAEKTALLRDAQVVSYVEDIGFQLTRENNPVELLRYLEVLVQEDGYQTNITNVGTGTQSAVIIAMLELALRRRSTKIRIFAVEEPDAFIHPHGVRHLSRLIRQVGDDNGSQVVVTTHSPSLLAGLKPADIVRVEKRNGSTTTFQAPGSLGEPTFSRFIDSQTGEMFFARRVILVEGDTERFLFPPIASVLDQNGSMEFDRQRISIISMDTKDNVVNYLKILD
jgi:putative ATP-dependent endonuclease of OLD family